VQESSHARVAPALGCGGMGYPGQLRSWLHRQRLSVLELLGTATSAHALLCDNADENPTNKHVLASLVRVASGFHLGPSRTSTLVWLQDVERKWTEGITSGLGPRWVYRRARAPEEGATWPPEV
jgi:hypothetical protein